MQRWRNGVFLYAPPSGELPIDARPSAPGGGNASPIPFDNRGFGVRLAPQTLPNDGPQKEIRIYPSPFAALMNREKLFCAPDSSPKREEKPKIERERAPNPSPKREEKPKIERAPNPNPQPQREEKPKIERAPDSEPRREEKPKIERAPERAPEPAPQPQREEKPKIERAPDPNPQPQRAPDPNPQRDEQPETAPAPKPQRAPDPNPPRRNIVPAPQPQRAPDPNPPVSSRPQAAPDSNPPVIRAPRPAPQPQRAPDPNPPTRTRPNFELPLPNRAPNPNLAPATRDDRPSAPDPNPRGPGVISAPDSRPNRSPVLDGRNPGYARRGDRPNPNYRPHHDPWNSRYDSYLNHQYNFSYAPQNYYGPNYYGAPYAQARDSFTRARDFGVNQAFEFALIDARSRAQTDLQRQLRGEEPALQP